MKFECKCGNVVNEHHGKYTRAKEGKVYYLFYCKECKSSFKVDTTNNNVEYNYRLLEEA